MNWRGWVVAGTVAALVLSLFGSLGYYLGYPFDDGYAYGFPAAFAVIGWAMVGVVGFVLFITLGVRSLEWASGEPFIPTSVTGWFKRVILRRKPEPKPEPAAENSMTFYAGGVIPSGLLGSLPAGSTLVTSPNPSTAAKLASYHPGGVVVGPVTKKEPAMDEFSGVGFAAGTVRGARAWNIDKLGRLTGITYPQVWTPGENKATCRRGSYTTGMFTLTSIMATPTPRTTLPATDTPPDHDMSECGHGFYGYYEGSNDYGRDHTVSGVLEAYGEAIIGTRGFRAMKARILALTFGAEVTPGQRALVTRNYPDIPVFDTFAGMVDAFPPDAGGQEYGPHTDDEFWVREA